MPEERARTLEERYRKAIWDAVIALNRIGDGTTVVDHAAAVTGAAQVIGMLIALAGGKLAPKEELDQAVAFAVQHIDAALKTALETNIPEPLGVLQ